MTSPRNTVIEAAKAFAEAAFSGSDSDRTTTGIDLVDAVNKLDQEKEIDADKDNRK